MRDRFALIFILTRGIARRRSFVPLCIDSYTYQLAFVPGGPFDGEEGGGKSMRCWLIGELDGVSIALDPGQESAPRFTDTSKRGSKRVCAEARNWIRWMGKDGMGFFHWFLLGILIGMSIFVSGWVGDIGWKYGGKYIIRLMDIDLWIVEISSIR